MNFLKYLIYPAYWLSICLVIMLAPLEYRWMPLILLCFICLSDPPKSVEEIEGQNERNRRLSQDELSKINESSSLYTLSVWLNKIIFSERKPRPFINVFLRSVHPAILIERKVPLLSTTLASTVALIAPLLLAPLLIESFALHTFSDFDLADKMALPMVFSSIENTTYSIFVLAIFLLSKFTVTRRTDAYIGVAGLIPVLLIALCQLFIFNSSAAVDPMRLLGFILLGYGVVAFTASWVYYFICKPSSDREVNLLGRLLWAARSPMTLINIVLLYTCIVFSVFTIYHEFGYTSYKTRSEHLIQNQESADGYYFDFRELKVQPVSYINILNELKFEGTGNIGLPLSLQYIIRESVRRNWVDGVMIRYITRMHQEDMREYAKFILDYLKDVPKSYNPLPDDHQDFFVLDARIATEILELLAAGETTGYAAVYEKYKSDFEDTSMNGHRKAPVHNVNLPISSELLVKLGNIDEYRSDIGSIKMVNFDPRGDRYENMSNKVYSDSLREDFEWFKANRSAIDELIRQNATRPDACTIEQLYCIPDVLKLALS